MKLRSFLSKLLSPTTKVKTLPPKVQSTEEPLVKYCPGGYHPVALGDTFNAGRFTVIRKLGWGQYSTVWLAKDAIAERHVALKILTHDSSSTPALNFDEAGLLTCVKEANPMHPGRKHIISMEHHFKHVGPNGSHVCIAFEVLGPSIREIVRRFRGRLPQVLVKRIAMQVLLALDFLHNSCGIIHSDIKPDNILLYTENIESMIQDDISHNPPCLHAVAKRSKYAPAFLVQSQPLAWAPLLDTTNPAEIHLHVKLADLGAGNRIDKHTVDVIQPIALRAPEVILGAEWGPSAEIWGLAGVLYYLLSGTWMIDPRFAAEHNITEGLEILAQITMLLGDVPMELIKAGKHSQKFYTEDSGKLSGVDIQLTDFNLHKLIEMDSPRDMQASDVDRFVDFLSRMLKILPRERESAAQLLQHPWLQMPMTSPD